VGMVANSLEEYAAAEEGDLKGLDVDVGMVVAPGVGPDAVGDDGSEETVKVAEEEDCAVLVSHCCSWNLVAHTECYRRATQ
jgi:hypothetical protein